MVERREATTQERIGVSLLLIVVFLLIELARWLSK